MDTSRLLLNSLLASLLAVGLATTGFAQKGFVGQGDTAMLLIDPTSSGSATAFGWSDPTSTGDGASRGHLMGHDGKVYRSAWDLNGIVVNDYLATTPTVTRLVNDVTNEIMGAGYQPVLDFNSIGGPGIVCIDGNTLSSPFPSGHRNWFSVDVNAKTFKIDGTFSGSGNVPMSDCYRNPHNSSEFVTVGFSSFDSTVRTWKLPGSGSVVTPNTVVTLNNPCGYDAVILEDQQLYCWTSTANGPIGFQVVDLKAKTQTFLAVSGMTHLGAGYAAVWSDPFEKPGRMVYILQDSTSKTVAEKLYKVDMLATGGPKATLVAYVPPQGFYNTGRGVENGQLTSWATTTPGKRTFRINFGTVQAGDVYFLFPTLAGYSSTKLVVDGFEVWITPDVATLLAGSGAIPNAIGSFSSTNGIVDVDITLPALNTDIVWGCALIRASKTIDISNYIITPH